MPSWHTLFGAPPSPVELVAAAVIAARPKQRDLVLSIYVALPVIILEQARLLSFDAQMPLNLLRGVMTVDLGHIILLCLWAALIIFPIRRYILNQKGRRVFTRR